MGYTHLDHRKTGIADDQKNKWEERSKSFKDIDALHGFAEAFHSVEGFASPIVFANEFNNGHANNSDGPKNQVRIHILKNEFHTGNANIPAHHVLVRASRVHERAYCSPQGWQHRHLPV